MLVPLEKVCTIIIGREKRTGAQQVEGEEGGEEEKEEKYIWICTVHKKTQLAFNLQTRVDCARDNQASETRACART